MGKGRILADRSLVSRFVTRPLRVTPTLAYNCGLLSRLAVPARRSRAVNSAVECHLHTVEVSGSIPLPPTTIPPRGTRIPSLPHKLRVIAPISACRHVRDKPCAGYFPSCAPSL